MRSLANELPSLENEHGTNYEAIDAALSELRVDDRQGPDVPEAEENQNSSAPNSSEGTKVDQSSTKAVVDHVPTSTVGEDTTATEAPPNKLAVSKSADEDSSCQETSSDIVDLSAKRISRIVETEIERSRFSFAYHLTRATSGVFPSANAIMLIACNYVTAERASVAADLPNLAAKLADEAATALNSQPNPSLRRCHAALIAGAALTPARIAPGGPVAQLILSLEAHLRDMPSLWALSKTAAEVSLTGVHLPPEMLREDDTLAKWDDNIAALREETNSWIESERRTRLRFQGATRVWRRILDDWADKRRASIGRMFNILKVPLEELDTDEMKRIADFWRDNGEKEIDRIDREWRNISTTKKIDGPVRVDLRNKIFEAVSFADRWSALIDSRPDRRSDYQAKQANILRTSSRAHGQISQEEIANLNTPTARQALALVRRYLDSFQDPTAAALAPRMTLADLLNGDLLVDQNVRFEMGYPVDEAPARILLRLAEQDGADFRKGAVGRARGGDFAGAEAAIDFAERSGYLGDDDADSARTTVEEERVRAQQKLKSRVFAAGNRLDAAYARGILPTETFEERRRQIPSTEEAEIGDFRPLFAKLDQINRQISKDEQKKHQDLKERLAHLEGIQPADKLRVEDAIEHSRFQVAEDFIERVGRGEALPAPEATTDRPFDHFFPTFVEKYTAFREGSANPLAQILETLEHRGSRGPIDASHLSVDTSRDGIRLIKAWAELCAGKLTRANLQELMSALGFTNPKLRQDGRRSPGETVVALETEAIANRKIVQLPDFGSRAGGRYRLVAIRDRSTHEAILQEVGERQADGSPPTLILFLNILDVDGRRALAPELRPGTYHPALVLDEALVAFLATLPGQYLGAFFDCASAFTFAQPFDPDAIEVPPEMFFGRKAERDRILAMSDEMTHLVYGGRRLGKTALLANIAREYQNRAPDQLVLFLNLKGTDIGSHHPTHQFWSLLASQLAAHGIVSPRTVRHDSISESVRNWLGAKHVRRILILVDEADDFLNADRPPQQGYRRPEQGYRVLTQIKRLMDDTGRRFKVVFSGLHNVQRSARDPNTPFAHLGEPVRIGPMLPETDGSAIENLIREPLEALGYRFASADSVIHIAAETNYHPALAQQFCKELLRHIRESSETTNGAGPPFTIPTEMVDRVFESKETRDRIRNLFSWTIQLDPRYEFLTYLVAQQSFDSDGGQRNGVAIRDIRDTALREWRQGFASDPSYWAFEVLLEEMVGLGILREDKDHGFAIRTRNLRMLLGNDAEIERRFSDAKNRTTSNFDPAQFRKSLKDKTLSSLTAGQEERLLSGRPGIELIFGTRLAGLDQVGESIRRAFESKEEPPRVHDANAASSRSLLGEISRSRKSGIDIVLVDGRGIWSSEWIGKALDFVAGLDAQNRTIRPVFVGGAAEAWVWLNEPRPTLKRNAELREMWLGPCSTNFGHAWLRDWEAPAFADLENPKQPLDPPWPVVMSTAARNTTATTMKEAINLTLEEHANLVFDIFNVAQTKPILDVFSEFPNDLMTIDDLSDVSGMLGNEVSPEEVARIVDWASRLSLIHRDEKGYRLDSTYAAGIKAAFEE